MAANFPRVESENSMFRVPSLPKMANMDVPATPSLATVLSEETQPCAPPKATTKASSAAPVGGVRWAAIAAFAVAALALVWHQLLLLPSMRPQLVLPDPYLVIEEALFVGLGQLESYEVLRGNESATNRKSDRAGDDKLRFLFFFG